MVTVEVFIDAVELTTKDVGCEGSVTAAETPDAPELMASTKPATEAAVFPAVVASGPSLMTSYSLSSTSASSIATSGSN